MTRKIYLKMRDWIKITKAQAQSLGFDTDNTDQWFLSMPEGDSKKKPSVWVEIENGILRKGSITLAQAFILRKAVDNDNRQ